MKKNNHWDDRNYIRWTINNRGTIVIKLIYKYYTIAVDKSISFMRNLHPGRALTYLCNLRSGNCSTKDNSRWMKCFITTHVWERSIHKFEYILDKQLRIVRHIIKKMAMPMSCWETVLYFCFIPLSNTLVGNLVDLWAII